MGHPDEPDTLYCELSRPHYQINGCRRDLGVGTSLYDHPLALSGSRAAVVCACTQSCQTFNKQTLVHRHLGWRRYRTEMGENWQPRNQACGAVSAEVSNIGMGTVRS